MSLAVLIADDEAPARRKLARFLAEYHDIDVVGEASNGIDALDLLVNTKPALAFLDIAMPELDGIGVAEAIAHTSTPPKIVFVTAFDQFAVKAFEVSAIDYLLKPYDRERFAHALARARDAVARSGAPADLAALLAQIRREDRYLRRILIPSDGRSFFLAVAEIVRLEASGDAVCVFARNGTQHRLRVSLESLEARLDPGHFARVHRSHVVNIDAIAEIAPWSHGDYNLTLRDGTKIGWSRRYAAKRPDLLT